MTEVQVELTARQELEEIAEVLRGADETEKEAKKLKEEVRGPFFELISEVVRDEVVLTRQTVEVSHEEAEPFQHDLEAWQRRNYPEWRVVNINPSADSYTVVIEENEDLKKFEFVANGYKYGRTIRMTGKSFLAEEFLEYLKKLEAPAALKKKLKDTVSKNTVVTYDFDEGAAISLMAEQPEVVAHFQKFINPGVPTPALIPIKPAKEDDEA